MDFTTIGITILAMAIVWMAHLGMAELVLTKIEVSQVARKYMLRMETIGYLTGEEKANLTEELSRLGMEKINFTGTTMQPVGYGEDIYLCLKGTVQGISLDKERIWKSGFTKEEFVVARELMSTAKN